MSPSLKCRFTINTYSRDIALGQHIQDWKKCAKTLHRHFSSVCEDLRGVERCCDFHHKPVGVRNHGSFPRRTEPSTSIVKSIARQFFTTHGDHRWTCRIVAHCMSRRASEKLKTVGSLFSWNVRRGHIVESFTVEKVRFVLPRVLSVGDPICFSS